MKKLHTKTRLLAAAVLPLAVAFLVNTGAYAQGLLAPTDAIFGDVIFTQDFGDYDGISGVETQNGSPTSLEKIGGTGSIGDVYTYTANPNGPSKYAIVTGIKGGVPGAINLGYVRDFKDHTGLVDNTTSPYNPVNQAHNGSGRMLYIDLDADLCVVYKQQVTQMCRASSYEFSVWVASVHNDNNNTAFRLEVWSNDPDENGEDCTNANNSSVGETLANNATLLAATMIKPELGKWLNPKLYFELQGQTHCYVVLRNYSDNTSGNDVVVDDISIRPYAPFDLNVALAANASITACENGLVTIFSKLQNVPDYVKISQYAFFFEGKSEETGEWVRLGNEVPLQTQTDEDVLELTLPVTEYALYTHFRLAVAATPAGFGGQCVTFSQSETEADKVPGAPEFILLGEDVCVAKDDAEPEKYAKFIIKHINQIKDGSGNGGNWRIKVRTKDGRVMTLQPCAVGADCPDGYSISG